MYGWALVTLHLSTRNTYPWHPKPTSQCLQRTTNDLVKQYPNCRVTFLEIPIFSIKEWNEHNKHKTPDQFKDQDLKLEEHVYNLNNKIRTTNVENNNHSPIFSTDIKNQKGRPPQQIHKTKVCQLQFIYRRNTPRTSHFKSMAKENNTTSH
jgi:hypothetical protein